MSHWQEIDDPQLKSIEQRLQSQALLPADDDRNHLLYACGREVGRHEGRRTARIGMAAAACFGIVAGGLAINSLGGRLGPTPAQPVAEAVRPDFVDKPDDFKPPAIQGMSQPAKRKAAWTERVDRRAGRRQLSVGTPLDQALALLDAPSPIIEPDARPGAEPLREPLRATSQFFR